MVSDTLVLLIYKLVNASIKGFKVILRGSSAAALKGMKSCRTRGIFVHPFVHLSVRSFHAQRLE